MGLNNGKRPSDAELFDLLDSFQGMLRQMVRGGVTFHSFQKHIGILYANAAVDEAHGNYSLAASKIGLHRNTMTRIMAGKRVDAYGKAVPTASGRQDDKE